MVNVAHQPLLRAVVRPALHMRLYAVRELEASLERVRINHDPAEVDPVPAVPALGSGDRVDADTQRPDVLQRRPQMLADASIARVQRVGVLISSDIAISDRESVAREAGVGMLGPEALDLFLERAFEPREVRVSYHSGYDTPRGSTYPRKSTEADPA